MNIYICITDYNYIILKSRSVIVLFFNIQRDYNVISALDYNIKFVCIYLLDFVCQCWQEHLEAQ